MLDGRDAGTVGAELLGQVASVAIQPLPSGRLLVEDSEQPDLQMRTRTDLLLDSVQGALLERTDAQLSRAANLDSQFRRDGHRHR
ncbi:MAG: hypothetical protein R3B96_16960 [Pirellulaceae bacterium]